MRCLWRSLPCLVDASATYRDNKSVVFNVILSIPYKGPVIVLYENKEIAFSYNK